MRRNRRMRILLPYEVALQRLEDIRALMQPSRAREFSTAVSDVVRNYIEQRFEVAVTRRTTEEFLRELIEFPMASLARHQSLLSDFLQQCDLVKFAAVSLASQSMESLHHSARTFVLATVKTEEVASVKVERDSLPIS
jgi:cell division FtsZ-interacting protein ZapD